MTSKQYIVQNTRLWEENNDLLAGEDGHRYAFPFTHLFAELPDIDHDDDDAVEVTTEIAAPQKAILPTQVLEVAREAIGGSSPIDADTSLVDAGLDSLAATELRAWLSAKFGADVPAVLLFDFPTARQLASHLSVSASSDSSGAGGLPIVKSLKPAELLKHASEAIGGGVKLDTDTSLIDAGLDSLAATELRAWLSTRCGIDVPAVALFDFPSARQLASHLTSSGEAVPSGEAMRLDEESTAADWAWNAMAESIAESPDGPALLRRFTRRALGDPRRLKHILRWMLEWQFSPQRSARRGEIAEIFFELVLSPSGSMSELVAGTTFPQTTGVLILGFAGSSIEVLQPVRQFYSRLRPSWRVISTTTVFESEARREQLQQVLHQLDGLDQLIVHSMSNHGHRSFMSLLDLDLDQSIGRRLKALVFDCGPAPALSAEGRTEAAARTAFGALLGHGLQISRAQQDEIRAAAALVDWAWQTDDDVLKQATKESVVPTMCLCGESDVLFPLKAAQHFAGLLQRERPERKVYLECLAGDHCNLLHSAPTDFESAISKVLREALLL